MAVIVAIVMQSIAGKIISEFRVNSMIAIGAASGAFNVAPIIALIPSRAKKVGSVRLNPTDWLSCQRSDPAVVSMNRVGQ